MAIADERHDLGSGVWIWHAYDPAAKVDLFSASIHSATGTFIVDPIPLAAELLEDWENVIGVVITNANHHRAAFEFSRHFDVPVFARAASVTSARPTLLHDLDQSENVPGELTSISIEGAAPGEIALCINGSLILGDALINFEPHGLTFLPAKYCTNFKVMRQSLRQLLELDFERILFAHGMPITFRAHERLVQLLEQ